MIDKNESKADKFKRLAMARTNRVIEDIRILSNLSNKRVYDYSQDEVNKMFRAIEKQVKEAKAQFAVHGEEFKL